MYFTSGIDAHALEQEQKHFLNRWIPVVNQLVCLSPKYTTVGGSGYDEQAVEIKLI